VAELVPKSIAGASGAGSGGVAALNHEAGYHAVEDGIVIEAIAAEEHEVVHGLRRVSGVEVDGDIASAGADDCLVLLRQVDCQVGCVVVLLGHRCSRYRGNAFGVGRHDRSIGGTHTLAGAPQGPNTNIVVVPKLPTDRQIYVYCKSGFRAGQALSSLGMLGYDNVLSYKPGWNGWTETGQDVSTEAVVAEVVGAPDIAPELVAAVNGYLSTIPEGWLSAGGPDDVQAALDAGAIALDVRTAGEYAEGNVGGSLNIDLRELAVGIEGVSTSANVVTYCGSGHRSAMALAALQVLGADNVKAYGGSYTSLVDAGLPVATP
jgi:rhodanese-related sulfurtransferase